MTRMSQTCFLRLFLILDAEFKLKLIIFKTGILVSASGRIATSYILQFVERILAKFCRVSKMCHLLF